MPSDDRHRLTWAKVRQVLGYLMPTLPSELAHELSHIPPEWPERLTLIQAAALQMVPARNDRDAWHMTNTLCGLMRAAIEAGELQAEIETRTIPAEPAKVLYETRAVQTWESGIRRELVPRHVRARKARTERTHWLRAHDFESWLRGVGQTPGEHVMAWLAASAAQLNVMGDPRRAKRGKGDPATRDRDRRILELFDQAWSAEQQRHGDEAQKKRARQEVARQCGLDPNDSRVLERLRKVIGRQRERAPQERVTIPATIKRSAWCPT